VQVFEFLLPLSLLWSFMTRHVFGSCACCWFTCLLMFVLLVYLNACVFIAYLVPCIRSRVYKFLNSNLRISLLVLSSITKKGEIVTI
jgi:hypothetical protein